MDCLPPSSLPSHEHINVARSSLGRLSEWRGSRQHPTEGGVVAKICRKGCEGASQTRKHTSPDLTRKLGIENLLEPAEVMGLKSSFPPLNRPQYYAFYFSFACHVFQNTSGQMTLSSQCSRNGKFMDVRGPGPRTIEPFVLL